MNTEIYKALKRIIKFFGDELPLDICGDIKQVEDWIEKMEKTNIDINDAQHPSRQKAIEILEAIAEELGDNNIFDCKDGDTKWYDFEDMVVEIIEKGREVK